MSINKPFSIGHLPDDLSLWQAARTVEAFETVAPGNWSARRLDRMDAEEVLNALASGMVDAAAVSATDLPLELPGSVQIAAALPRGVVNDALVCHIHLGFRDLPVNAKIGVVSARQSGQLLRLRSDVTPQFIPADINGSLARIDAGELDAVMLSWVELRRLGLAWRVDDVFGVTELLPFPGHGITAILTNQDRGGVVEKSVSAGHASTLLRLRAERAFARALGFTELAGFAALASDYGREGMRLVGRVVARDGSEMIEAERNILFDEEPERLGEKVAAELLQRGANKLVDR